jgi:monoamine oxidase
MCDRRRSVEGIQNAGLRFRARWGMVHRTMSALSRRRFLATSAASAAAGTAVAARAPALAAQVSREVDIAIIGAGAAGIAAARRIAATPAGAGARLAIVEASGRIGGRCFTDTTTFGVPYDRGAHWIHVPDQNPVTPLAAASGFDIYPAPPGQRVRIGRRNARQGEMEDYLTVEVRANRAIIEAGRGRLDSPAAQALPRDLGEWQRTVEFVLGPFGCAKDLAEVSAADFSRSAERDTDSFCRQGFGAVIAKLGAGLPVDMSNPVTRIDWGARNGIDIDTAKGRLSARCAIVTVSTGVLAAGRIKFSPELPRRHLDAIEKLRPGSYEHIALELPGNPLGLAHDDMVFEKSDSPRTAALLGNVSGTALCLVEVAGTFGRDLAADGDETMIAFAIDWLAGLYGNAIRTAVKRSHATGWNSDPWTLGAFSAAAPGGLRPRAVLAEPLRGLFFAGEATHETLWGTVGGAWASGERAADAALRRLGYLAGPPPEPKPPAAPPRRRQATPG